MLHCAGVATLFVAGTGEEQKLFATVLPLLSLQTTLRSCKVCVCWFTFRVQVGLPLHNDCERPPHDTVLCPFVLQVHECVNQGFEGLLHSSGDWK